MMNVLEILATFRRYFVSSVGILFRMATDKQYAQTAVNIRFADNAIVMNSSIGLR